MLQRFLRYNVLAERDFALKIKNAEHKVNFNYFNSSDELNHFIHIVTLSDGK